MEELLAWVRAQLDLAHRRRTRPPLPSAAEHDEAGADEVEVRYWISVRDRLDQITRTLDNHRPWSVEESLHFRDRINELAAPAREGGLGPRWHPTLADAVKAARPYAAVQANLGLLLARLEPGSPLAVADLAGLGLVAPPAQQLAARRTEYPLIPPWPPQGP
jgi:hypothetical protein